MRRLMPWARKPAATPKAAESGVIRQAKRPTAKMIVWGMVGMTMASITGYAMLDSQRVMDEVITLSGNAGLNLQVIEVDGRAHTPADMLIAVTGLERGQPLYGIDLVALHDRVSSIGWVEDATIERLAPSTIKITLQERVPVALMQTVNGHELIDQAGAIITGANAEDFTHLTVVSGKGAATRAGSILALLRTEPELFANVWAITLQSGRRWDVHLRNGIDVRLPEIDPRTAWSRLAIMDHHKQITRRDLAVIDLRIPEQLIVEPNIPVPGKGRNT